MSPVAVRRRPGPASSPRTLSIPHGVAAVGTIASFLVAMALSRQPARIERVTVVNRSPYDLTIDVRGADESGWLTLGAIDERTTADMEEVLDQGGRWTFRVAGQGRAAGTFTLSRTQLAQAGWRVDVPPAIATALQAAGAPPSP